MTRKPPEPDRELDTVAAALRARGGEREVEELAWLLVRRENRELRKSHPRAYQWARAYLDGRGLRRRRT